MQPQPPPYDLRTLDAFIASAGTRLWTARMAEIGTRAASGHRTGQAVRQRHALELAIERLRGPLTRPPSGAELRAARLADDTVALLRRLHSAGRARLRERFRSGLAGHATLVPLFHMLRTASLQASRGFGVGFAGLEDGVPYDLLISRGAWQAEIACEVVSAEEGRLVQRGAWSRLVDCLEDDVRSWLTSHPGRYLLKMTLPQGLASRALADVQARIQRLLATGSRRDHDDTAVLRLEPFLLSGPDGDPQLLSLLRREFGPEAHLAVITAGGSVFVMAARAGRADEIGVAVRRRLVDIAPRRLSGARPGILAMFIEDTDRSDWLGLRSSLALEGEARQFLAYRSARPVIAVTCASRMELFGMTDAAEEGELRFRNSAHPAAKTPALLPAILSSL